jgi:hypothetical protein
MHGASHTAPALAFYFFSPILFDDGDKMEAAAREYREEAGRCTTSESGVRMCGLARCF